MIRTIICFGWLGISLCLCMPVSWRLSRLKGKIPEDEFAKRAHKFTSWWAKTLVGVSGAKIHTSGYENIPMDENVLFVSNHQSDFDIVLFLALSPIPIGFVAKIEMMKVPLLRTWMRHIQSIFIDRKDIRQTAKVMLSGIEILKTYCASGFPFPGGNAGEGRRGASV